MAGGPHVAAVVVCHDSAHDAPPTLAALAAQLGPGDELIVVDNASVDGTPDAVRAAVPSARVIESGANLGFAGGCDLGARAATAPLLLFVNPDAVPAPDFVERLRAVDEHEPGWGAWQALVTLADGRHVNSAGNVAHWLGVGWAGLCDEPVAAAPRERTEVPFPSGAAFMVRTEAWRALGGFDERYFMYGEDQDLGLRLRLAGWGVGIEPAALIAHDYEFTKGDYKWFHLERNRWWTVLSDYPGPLLVLVLPALLAFEIALLAVAARGGWLRAKLRSQARVVRELPAILRRRRAVQATRTVSAAQFASGLSASLDSPYLAGAATVPLLPAAQRAYWRLVRALLALGG